MASTDTPPVSDESYNQQTRAWVVVYQLLKEYGFRPERGTPAIDQAVGWLRERLERADEQRPE